MTKTMKWLGAALIIAAMTVAVPLLAQTQEVKSLRGDFAIDENNEAPEIFGQKKEGLARAYRQQPPLIPHRADKYQIDLKVNQCLRCHDWPYSSREGAPKVSETHYIDRNGRPLDKVARTRWFCNQCHVPQANAVPLVENLFKPADIGQ